MKWFARTYVRFFTLTFYFYGYFKIFKVFLSCDCECFDMLVNMSCMFYSNFGKYLMLIKSCKKGSNFSVKEGVPDETARKWKLSAVTTVKYPAGLTSAVP